MKIALAGNPNSGKTTLFNALTKSSAHVGNYPGVTVERRTGYYKHPSGREEIIDLPGIYSLSPHSPEEVISRRELLENDPDVVVNIVDATNLERNLYLTTQLLELDIPVVVALNMMDAADKNGMSIDREKLSGLLGVPVLPISALKRAGLPELMQAAIAAQAAPRKGRAAVAGTYLDALLLKSVALYEKKGVRHPVFHAVKAIEADSVEAEAYPDLLAALVPEKAKTKNDFEGDFEGMVADLRYKYLDTFIHDVFKGRKSHKTVTKSDKADKVLTHRVWGIPLFILIMFAVFHLTFSESLFFISWTPANEEPTFIQTIFGHGAIHSPGVILFNLMEQGMDALTGLAVAGLPEGTWYTGLLVDGLMGGLFAILSFIPQILLLFLFISILEDTGYMARVAFIMDRILRRFGLSGRAIMPLITCFGCAVPGIMATRTLENEKERRMTILLAPFFSCGAKLPVWAAFGAVLWGGAYADILIFGIYLLGIVVAILSAIILNKLLFKNAIPVFIMELPEYHRPQFRNTMRVLWERLKHYIVRAATIIASAVIVLWFLNSFGWAFWQGIVDDPKQSIIGSISYYVLQWAFYPLGFAMGDNGWMFVAAAFSGLIAKEIVAASLHVFAGVADDDSEERAAELFGVLVAGMVGGVPAALSFMAFNLLSVPCMAAVAAARSEFHSGKKLWFAVGYWMLTAYVVSAAIYWIGTYWWISLILVGVLAAAVGAYYLVKRGKKTGGGGSVKAQDKAIGE
ncbi:MAG: ferrous iron transport protein B [Clostridiales bacterium]|jgi:ferrous iron transport protein B|nr:ferrous iron transport protein B [Clostridiales bacterium]